MIFLPTFELTHSSAKLFFFYVAVLSDGRVAEEPLFVSVWEIQEIEKRLSRGIFYSSTRDSITKRKALFLKALVEKEEETKHGELPCRIFWVQCIVVVVQNKNDTLL